MILDKKYSYFDSLTTILKKVISEILEYMIFLFGFTVIEYAILSFGEIFTKITTLGFKNLIIEIRLTRRYVP